MNVPWWGKVILTLLVIWAFMHPAQAGAGLHTALTGTLTFLKNL